MRRNVLAAALLVAFGAVSFGAQAAPGDTTLGGKMYVDFTNITLKDNGQKTGDTGTGLDVKRFYLSVTHQFDPIWSVNLTTDFNYATAIGETNVFVKKAYVQGDFSKALRVRAGAADMPWIPFVESYYGYRYVENTLTDRLHYANSADWGVNVSGNVGANDMIDYSVSAVNGGGYKHSHRSQDVDFEGRVGFAPVKGAIIAVGGYNGKLAKDLPNTTTYHSASRVDGMLAYASKQFRVGVEYFQAKDWGNVTTPYADKADGYSVWGSVSVADGVDLFARYDDAKLSKDVDPSLKDKYYNAGVQFVVTKGVEFALAWKHETMKGNTALMQPISIPAGFHPDRKMNEIGVWGQVKF